MQPGLAAGCVRGHTERQPRPAEAPAASSLRRAAATAGLPRTIADAPTSWAIRPGWSYARLPHDASKRA